MHIECMVMHDVQNESLVFLYQLGTLSPLPSGEKEVSQTPHRLYLEKKIPKLAYLLAIVNYSLSLLTIDNFTERPLK